MLTQVWRGISRLIGHRGPPMLAPNLRLQVRDDLGLDDLELVLLGTQILDRVEDKAGDIAENKRHPQKGPAVRLFLGEMH